jgi:hypothetical protein
VATNGANVLIGFNALEDVAARTAPGTGVVFYDAYYVLSANSGASFGSPVKISATSSDPDVASTNGLTAQFLGDYNGDAAGPDGTFWFTWTDTRNGATCRQSTPGAHPDSPPPNQTSTTPAQPASATPTSTSPTSPNQHP